jgi:hypothetical protein
LHQSSARVDAIFNIFSPRPLNLRKGNGSEIAVESALRAHSCRLSDKSSAVGLSSEPLQASSGVVPFGTGLWQLSTQSGHDLGFTGEGLIAGLSELVQLRSAFLNPNFNYLSDDAIRGTLECRFQLLNLCIDLGCFHVRRHEQYCTLPHI